MVASSRSAAVAVAMGGTSYERSRSSSSSACGDHSTTYFKALSHRHDRVPVAWITKPIRSARRAAGADGVGQLAQRRYRVRPGEARVGDALTACQRLARDRVLPAADQVALDHHARDRAAAGADLARDVARHLGLPRRIFAAVAVAAVDHQTRRQLRLL